MPLCVFLCVFTAKTRLELTRCLRADTRYKDKATGIEYISPTNRFWGSTMFAPKGKGMSQKGYLPVQVRSHHSLCDVCGDCGRQYVTKYCRHRCQQKISTSSSCSVHKKRIASHLHSCVLFRSQTCCAPRSPACRANKQKIP